MSVVYCYYSRLNNHSIQSVSLVAAIISIFLSYNKVEEYQCVHLSGIINVLFSFKWKNILQEQKLKHTSVSLMTPQSEHLRFLKTSLSIVTLEVST